MPLENRTVTCDVCQAQYTEHDQGHGFPGWGIIQGIGAVTPEAGKPILKRHTETVTCPDCTSEVSAFINELQLRRGSKT